MKKNEAKKAKKAKCAHCAKEFTPARKTQKYCSDACYRAEKAMRDHKRVLNAKVNKLMKKAKSLRLKEKIVLPKAKETPKHECSKKCSCDGKNRVVAVIVITKCDKPTGKRK